MALAIVLAAGDGARLGGPKALAQAAGRPLVAWVVETCRRSLVSEVIVVTGAEAPAVQAAVQVAVQAAVETTIPAAAEAAADAAAEALAARGAGGGDALAPVRVVFNEDWREGKTSSLQCGWRALAGAPHVLVFPVDHAAVRLVTLDLMLGVFGYAAAAPEVIVPVLQDGGQRRRGHPIVLNAKLKEAVLALGPDAPLNLFVREHEALEVPVDDEGILLNVNGPAELEAADRLLSSRA